MKKTLLPLILFVGMAALFYYVLGKMNEGEYNPRDIPTEFIGRVAPEFALPELFDIAETVRPSDMKGRVWLLNVWGTWCPECWREHAYLNRLKSMGVPIIGVNWRDQIEAAKDFLNKKGNPFYKVAFDPSSVAAIEWGVYGAPETFLIDAEGIIRAKHAGAVNAQVWSEKFEPWFSGKGADK